MLAENLFVFMHVIRFYKLGQLEMHLICTLLIMRTVLQTVPNRCDLPQDTKFGVWEDGLVSRALAVQS